MPDQGDGDAGDRDSKEGHAVILEGRSAMRRRCYAVLAVLLAVSVPALADLVPGGDFQLYKPGTGYTVTATLSGPGAFDSYAAGVGDGIPLKGATATATWGDGSGVSDVGGPVDLPGWVSVHGGNPDTGLNGVDGSSGLNMFAAWGGNGRVQTDAAVGTVTAGYTYTITAAIDGPVGGPIEGPLAFHLMANDIQLTATEPIPTFTGGLGFQTISRTYDLSALPDGVNAGDPLKIIIGVEDDNEFGNRMIWDNIDFTGIDGTPDLPGDANDNGFVDDDDLAVLLSNWETDPGTLTTWALGDFTGDTDVDDDDLAVLLGNWTGAPAAGAAVPEPATLALLGLGALSVVRRRRS